jgi:hypothetical protein
MTVYRHLSILPLTLVLAFVVLSYSAVQAQSCQATVTYDYPKQVNPAQQVHIAATVTGSCLFPAGFPMPNSYSVRVDVTDQSTGGIISSNSANTGYSASAYGTPYFTVTVNNTVVAPSTVTTWLLGFSVYVFAGGNTSPLYTAPGSAAIEVGTSVTAVISVTTVIFSTIQQEVTTIQTSTITQSYLSQQDLSGLIIALLVSMAIVWLLFRSRVRREDRTHVY